MGLFHSSGKTGISGNQLVECHECHELYHQVIISLYYFIYGLIIRFSCTIYHNRFFLAEGLFVPRHIYCLRNACSDKFDIKLTIAKKMSAYRIYRYPLRKVNAIHMQS